ncbi:b166 [Murid betaherpesvirus 8]|uniref:B166 n=1 Tax=Rat cytomegalovirus (isolate England) TaxID=1261657 RepID=A0A0E3X3M2_RCMVE|nr:b166 [Murid betaherpesvirus 8]WPH25057.1 b166 [Murid betaherpesvirus 8]WPH25191.1 b166 [Murid betaherpesvirus 8]
MCGQGTKFWYSGLVFATIIASASLLRTDDNRGGVPHVSAADPPKISFHYNRGFTYIQFSWSGLANDVRRGVVWNFVSLTGARISVARLDWLGFEGLQAGYGHEGDLFLSYGPPRGDQAYVTVAGWLRVPLAATGQYEYNGYGYNVSVFILSRPQVARLSSYDSLSTHPFTFRCLPNAAETKLAEDSPRDLIITWWIKERRLVTFIQAAKEGHRGQVIWERPPDAGSPFLVDHDNGDLLVFDRDAANRLPCLRCTRQGARYATSSILTCNDPEPSHPSLDSPDYLQPTLFEQIRRHFFFAFDWMMYTIFLLMIVIGVINVAIELFYEYLSPLYERIRVHFNDITHKTFAALVYIVLCGVLFRYIVDH